MIDLTICMAYYMNPEMLQVQYDNLAKQPQEIKDHIEYIVVDDGSPKGPAFAPESDIGCKVRLYRMREDIAWNQDACRNLAVEESVTDWVLLTDMDHVPSDELLERVISVYQLDKESIYTFGRVSAPEMLSYKPHPNSWLMTKDMYNNIGGYDERYRGVYGTDGDFRRRAQMKARRFLECPEVLIRYPREVVADASTTTLNRKDPKHELQKKQIRSEIKQSSKPEPQRFLMAWDRIF